MKKIILISGLPNSGKTNLSMQLAPFVRRIHMDSVCISLSIRRPELIPPSINPDSIPNIDSTHALSSMIHEFCLHLSRLGALNLIGDELIDVYRKRMSCPLVIEGFAINDSLDTICRSLESLGRVPVKVWCQRDLLRIDGENYAVPEGVDFLRRQLHPLKHA